MVSFPVSDRKNKDLAQRMEGLGLKESDIEESFIRGPGPGGQKRNKTSSSVRLLHRPTGLQVVVGIERSQSLNRFLARRRLVEILEQKSLGEKSPIQKAQNKIRKQKARRRRRAGTKLGLGLILVLGLLPASLGAAPYVWPLSGTTTPDAMNTSFGPRMNFSHWDFHDGIDLPAGVGTPFYAPRDGTVFLEGPGGTDGYSSRHVILQVNDPVDGTLYLPFLHLSAIDGAVTEGAPVTQGQSLGAVGDDDAAYPHLHFEVRKNSPFEVASVHPLHYFPYTDTANFSAPAADRWNILGGALAARLLFEAPDRQEGDLIRVEVDLMSGPAVLGTRTVSFDDKTTVNEGNSDSLAFKNDIAVEGYQASDMASAGHAGIKEGVLLRDLPGACDALAARVWDVSGNLSASVTIPVPAWTALLETVDFEDGLMPPAGWSPVTSVTGSGTSVANGASAGLGGSRGLEASDLSTSEFSVQSASIEMTLPPGRFQYKAAAWVNPVSVIMADLDNLYILHGAFAGDLGVAARIRMISGVLTPGLSAKKSDGTLTGLNAPASILTGSWRKWELAIQRAGTRMTTAVLSLDGVESARLTWDGVGYEMDSFRGGLGLSQVGAGALVHLDELCLSEDPSAACFFPVPTATPTPTTTFTASATPVPSSSPTSTPIPTLSESPTPTPTSSESPTHSPSISPSASPSPSPSLTPSPTRSTTLSASTTFSPSPEADLGEGEIVSSFIAPNPVVDGSPILVLESRGRFDNLSVRVFSSGGRRAGYWTGGEKFPGLFRYPLDMNLANGIYHYLVEMEQGGRILARKAGSFFVLR